jgi:hypothetical protein
MAETTEPNPDSEKAPAFFRTPLFAYLSSSLIYALIFVILLFSYVL